MSEEISIPEISPEQKAKFQEALQRRVKTVKLPFQESKGKEPEEEAEPKPVSDLMRKLQAHAARGVAKVPAEPQTKEVEAASPCVLTAGAILAVIGIAVYFGHKYWKTYGVTPEELA